MWRRKYALAFLATALVGLAIRVYTQNIVTGLFGAEPGEVLFTLLPVIEGLFLPALVALLVGYVLPKGFFLWGIAVVLLHPLNQALWINRALEAGVIESSGLGGLVVVETTFLLLFAGACTGAAALGAGLRLLWWWLRGESIGGLGTASNGA